MNICIIIPVYNEAKEIGRITDAIKQKGFDVVVVDDGSIDDSGILAEENGAIVIRNNIREGKGLSLQKGFQYALNHDYIGVITVDGDGQHEVDDIDSFMKMIKESPGSIIAGNRRQSYRPTIYHR